MYVMNDAMKKYMRPKSGIFDPIKEDYYELLAIYFEGGLRVIQGVVTTSWFWAHRGNLTVENCHDETGFECSLNLLHLDDIVPSNHWISAIRTVDRLLSNNCCGHNLRFVAAINEDSCTTRFHQIRNGQSWLVSDIDTYSTPLMYRDLKKGDSAAI